MYHLQPKNHLYHQSIARPKKSNYYRHHQMANQNQLQQQQHENVEKPQPRHKEEVMVVVIPLPAQGHLNQLLQLSTRIIHSHGNNIPVHFLGTTTHNLQAKLRSATSSSTSTVTNNIHFHDLDIPVPFLSPPPDPNSKNKFPSHLLPCFKASSQQLRHPVSLLLRSLSTQTRRLVVIHDSLMASVVQEVRFLPNAESYTFHSISAFAIYLFKKQMTTKPTPINENGFHGQLNLIPSLEGCYTEEFLEFVSSQYGYLQDFNSGGFIYNTCRVVEAKYLELLEKEFYQGGGKRLEHWALGPFNPVKNLTINSTLKKHHCLEWLDQQDTNSVIYVSFGTTVTMEYEQVEELAIGLKQSNHRFIWVLREADKGDVFSSSSSSSNGSGQVLPKGYEEELLASGMGLVVRDWAPQLEILGHVAIGGFMSHCGWNSCMESISMGVPLLAWPMHSDQPRNAFLLSQALKVGIVIRDWDNDRDQIVTSEVLGGAVKRLMGSKEGHNLRKRAQELGEAVRQSVVGDGGSSRLEFDSFIQHITR